MDISTATSTQTIGSFDSGYSSTVAPTTVTSTAPPGGSQQATDARASRGVSVPDNAEVTKAVQEINKRLADASTSVVYDLDTTSHCVWLNVVDKATGRVVSELPPEAIRKLVDSYAVSGLKFDQLR